MKTRSNIAREKTPEKEKLLRRLDVVPDEQQYCLKAQAMRALTEVVQL